MYLKSLRNPKYKILLRYLKESGKYPLFVRNYETMAKENIIPLAISKEIKPINLYNLIMRNHDFPKYIKNKYRKNIEEHFIFFLKFKKIFRKFKKSIDAEFAARNSGLIEGNVKDSSYFERFLDKVEPSEYINHAFYWSETKEGHSYWSKLNKEWVDEFHNYEDYITTYTNENKQIITSLFER